MGTEQKIGQNPAQTEASKPAADEQQSIGPAKAYARIFRYGTTKDYSMQAAATMCAVASGVAMAMVNLVFGKFITAITDYTTRRSSAAAFRSDAANLALGFFGIGIARFALSYGYGTLFTFAAYRITRNIRYMYLEAGLSQEIAYFDAGIGGSIATQATSNGKLIQAGISETIVERKRFVVTRTPLFTLSTGKFTLHQVGARRPLKAEARCNNITIFLTTVDPSEEKIDLIDSRLDRMSRVIETLAPGNTPAMGYYRSSVKLANLAGKTYEKLYSLHALLLSDDTRRRNATELSKELTSIQEETQNAMQAWLLSDVERSRHDVIEFISKSDQVLWHSMQTLIHRAVPVHTDSMTSFTDECIVPTRAALQHHQLSVPAPLQEVRRSRLHTSIVLFCHVLETGDVKDLELMQAFVDSIEPSCQDSIIISKHHRLFQVFHGVELRYTELKAESTPPQDGADAITEMDAYLNILGFQHQAAPNFEDDQHSLTLNSSMAPPQLTLPLQLHPGASEGSAVPESSSQLANWYHLSQQMMGLLDSSQFPL